MYIWQVKLDTKSKKLMKRLLLSIFLVAGLMVNAQEVLNEDFSGAFPPAGWSIDAHAANWSAENSAAAGGVAPEAFFSWSPQFSGATRLISPELNLSGESTILLQFRHFIDHYSGTYQIGVATRSNGGAWTNAWAVNITAPVNATTVMVPITDANVNSSTFQFCIFFNGSSYNINSWSIDDVLLSIPSEVDGTVSALAVPTYFVGSTDVNGTLANVGTTNITSYTINWKLDDGGVNSDVVTDQNIALGQVVEFSSTHTLTPEPGVHNLSVWVSGINGSSSGDNNPANDTLSKTLRIPTQTVSRTPMFEEFTSSTCAPCASFNNSVFNPFLSQNEEDLVYVKYQMNWPGSGDPYYTDEGGVRRNYYGVNAVPMLYVDGKNAATTSPGVNTAFNNSIANPAFVEIDSYYAIDGDNIIVKGQFLSYADLAAATMHIVVFEGITTGNVASNGETEFHHVMMKLLPDGYGTQLPAVASGTPFVFDHTFNMASTNVEEMSDLQVAIFLQDDATKEVFQSAYADLSGVGVTSREVVKLRVYPNPVTDMINLTIPHSAGNNFTLQIIDSKGIIVMDTRCTNNTGKLSISSNFGSGVYTVRIISESQLFSGKFISVK